MSELASPHIDIARGRKECVAVNEPSYLLFFRSTASVRCFRALRASFSRLELAQGVAIVISSRSALFLCRAWLPKSYPAFLLFPFVRG